MKIPESPPAIDDILEQLITNKANEKLAQILLKSDTGVTDEKGRYVHWEKLKHLKPPQALSNQEYWFAIKIARRKVFKKLSLEDKYGKPFCFCIPDTLHSVLHWLEQNATGDIKTSKIMASRYTQQNQVTALMEESISSSQLEGASTTRSIAKEMLVKGRKPNDLSEQMIFNNYQAMEEIKACKDEELTPNFILHLHEILMQNTLKSSDKVGKYRVKSDDIHVVDASSSIVLHTPPYADLLPERIQKICDFANQPVGDVLYPAIKAIILHFMIGYDHPFVDGNGRTARALFYWAMAKYGYWLTEFISISTAIKQAPVQYGKAYLHTETDENDLTYFLIHQADIIKKSIAFLYDSLCKKAYEIEEVEMLLNSANANSTLNYRQLSLLRHALKHPNAIYRIQEHRVFHAISYDTARRDLVEMSDQLNILRKRKEGNSFVFISPSDLKARLAGKIS